MNKYSLSLISSSIFVENCRIFARPLTYPFIFACCEYPSQLWRSILCLALRFLDSTKALLLINENLVEMRENNKRVEGKFDKIELKLNQTPSIQHIVWPVSSQIKPELLNSKIGLQFI